MPCALSKFTRFSLVSGSSVFLRLVRIAVLILTAVLCVSVFAILRIHLVLISSVCRIFAVLVFRLIIFCHLSIPPVECRQSRCVPYPAAVFRLLCVL